MKDRYTGAASFWLRAIKENIEKAAGHREEHVNTDAPDALFEAIGEVYELEQSLVQAWERITGKEWE